MRRYQKSSKVLFVSSPALITPAQPLVTHLPSNIVPNNLAPGVISYMGRNPPFCALALFLFVLLKSFSNKTDSSSNLTNFTLSSISSFEIIIAVMSNPKVCF